MIPIRFIIKLMALLAILFLVLVFTIPVYAEENIDPYNDGSQYSWGENVGWFNFEPSFGPGVTVDDYEVTGYVWAENIGWINLSPTSYGGVTNDGAGTLSGWAWGENVGWISVSCENTGSCDTIDYGVTVDLDGIFSGYGWGENIGWVNFDLATQPASAVQTSWEPAATLITLKFFTATPGNAQVTLRWITASEIDNAGFNLYRSEDGEEYEQINAELIPAGGTATEGAEYEFVDDDVENRTTYTYFLEDVDVFGVTALHGPVSATPRLIYGILGR